MDCSFLASCFSRSFTRASCLAFMSFRVTRPGGHATTQQVNQHVDFNTPMCRSVEQPGTHRRCWTSAPPPRRRSGRRTSCRCWTSPCCPARNSKRRSGKGFFFVADRQPDVQISVPAWEDEGKLGSNGRAKLALNCTSAQLLLLLL